MRNWLDGVLVYMMYLVSLGNTINPARDSCLNYESTYHLDRACECVIYQSYGGSSGRFTSPNFPQVYPRKTTCILYTFIGDVGEIVELTFLQFDLKLPSHNRCGDFVRVFQNLDRPEVNEYSKHDVELCGNISMIDKNFYSKSRSLVLEFHADGLPGGNYSGFQGLFHFRDKPSFRETDGVIRPRRVDVVNSRDEYTISGTRVPGTQCTYYFTSNNYNKTGRFFSPKYPQPYPASATCQYHFEALPGERVQLFFQNIQLHHQDTSYGWGSCRDSPDAVVVYDGRDNKSNVIGQYCDIHNQVELVSSGRYLFIEFYSDDRHAKKGFSATYKFISYLHPPDKNYHQDPQNGSRGTPWGSKITTLSPEFHCNENYNSAKRKNGTISSPFYPRSYPSDVTCRYTFQGVGRERVQIRFTHMDLYYPGGDATNPGDCEGTDSISVHVIISGKPANLGTYCGKKLPPMLMSNEPKLIVEFRSVQSSTYVTGFQADYSFVTNFGINEGKQDNRGVCMFNFFSTKQSQGTFSSPNYPGLYPRNTECHYLFYGRGKERVHITFPKFQVDGISPKCEEGTESDYVSFSNFAETEDRKMHRLCGVITEEKRRHIESDGPFFRVIFKSNDVYDAEGFQAFFKFRGMSEEKETLYQKHGTDEHIHGLEGSGAKPRSTRPTTSNGTGTNYPFVLLLFTAIFTHILMTST
ncbi:hypothetical protein SNE40_020630 [Patella caerulea]|uniref:CUB domain-containing protein n=1 Tax=Patella caerulea TaxID=87958 RepID=A0AAN8J5P4_PATCE